MSIQPGDMDAVLANVFLAVQKRLADLNLLDFIDQDLGQLDMDEERSPVKFPCGLLDICEIRYSDNIRNSQQGEAILELRLGLTAYAAATHYYTKDSHKTNALAYFNTEHTVNKALHGWSDDRWFNPLNRISSQTEKRKDNIRVRVLRYAFGFRDNTAMQVWTQAARPDMEIVPQV